MGDRGRRIKSPGRAHCQINFPASEQVVQVQVLDKVKAARLEVEQQYAADVMGVRGPQWTCSTALPDSKYTKVASDAHLLNQVLASTFCPSDLRRTKSPPRQRYDTEHYHAFTQGEATTGWNHSTVMPSRHQQAVHVQAVDSKALAAAKKHRQHVKRYQSPAQREQAFAAAQRQQKEAAAAQAAALVKQYGPEGAAATEYILTKKKLNRPYIHIKTFKEDVEAVHELPAAGLPSP